jgi:hypothetical protein
MPRHRARSTVATVLGVVAVLLLTVTVIGVWAMATVLRSEPVVEMAGDTIAQPEVQQALAAYLVDAAAEAVDLEAQLTNVLPDALDRFAPTIATGAEAAAEQTLEQALATPQVEQVVRSIVERAHDRAMQLLEGDGLVDVVNVDNGTITMNTLPLVTTALTSLQSATGLLSDVEIPQLSADGDPADQIAQLEQATGRDLPDDLGQLTVYESDAVAEAEESVRRRRACWRWPSGRSGCSPSSPLC